MGAVALDAAIKAADWGAVQININRPALCAHNLPAAYRQRAVACAAMLLAGRDPRVAASDAGQILVRNVYGWFERQARGLYRLTGLGEPALLRARQLNQRQHQCHVLLVLHDSPRLR